MDAQLPFACASQHPANLLLSWVMRELAEIMSDEELFSLPLEIQQANQRFEGLELPREVILDSLRPDPRLYRR